MGLDITVYSNLTYVGHLERPDAEDEKAADEFYERYIEAFSYEAFAGHALMGVPNVKRLTGISGGAFMTGGYFECTDKTETESFRAGSYSGYSAWRNDLAQQFNPYRGHLDGSPSPEGPFYGLLWFADNEGTICEMSAASLLIDFRQHEQAYRLAHIGHEHGNYFIEKYQDWTRACELASQGGLINFG